MTKQFVTLQHLGALSAVALLGVSGTASAIEAEISGHVNRAIMAYEDGEDSQTAFVDNETSNSRMRFRGSGEIMQGVSAGVFGEWEIVSTNSSEVTIDTTSSDNSEFQINKRHLDAFVEGGFGKVSLGQGDGAANGIAEIDLSGTSLINYAGVTDIGGSIAFQEGGQPFTANGAVGQARIRDTYSQFDFESRFDRVRYDTPSVGPFDFAIATGTKSDDDDTTDAAVRYGATYANGAQIAAGLGYSARSRGGDTGTVETFGGSASLLLANGLNFTLLYTQREDDADLDADTVWGKVGYKVGHHAVTVDVGQTNDLLGGGAFDSESTVYGIGYTYMPVNWAEFYAGVKQHQLDVSLASVSDPDDINIATVGTRLKF
ncbi:porin [Halomonas sp. EGI 63088]|uniref:Porin n=1 Tax=Halomonas flagellata TaxID=2920385 RepID=A0ABS9RVX2_9GAMM|nr:porin [Halomonas flagellata]MCH4563954.1 porin [Halomonas flagellata]